MTLTAILGKAKSFSMLGIIQFVLVALILLFSSSLYYYPFSQDTFLIYIASSSTKRTIFIWLMLIWRDSHIIILYHLPLSTKSDVM